MKKNEFAVGQILTRYVDTHTTLGVKIERRTYHVHSLTPKGAWIIPSYYKNETDDYQIKQVRRFVLSGAKKKYAWASKQDAAISFVARKRQEFRIYTDRLYACRIALAEGEKLLDNLD